MTSFFYQPFIAWDYFYIKKGQLIHVFEKWGLEYKIEFDFMVKKVPSDWINIVHFMHGTPGDRIPAIYLIPNITELLICYGVNNPYHDYRVVYTLNQKYHVVVKQFKVAEKYMYEIEVDDATVHSFENQQAEHFSDVKFYAGNPWKGSPTNDIALFENFEIFQ